MKVLVVNDKRFEIALKLFLENHSLNFNDVDFYLDKKNKILEIRVVSQWLIENLNEQKVLTEIDRGKETYNYLVDYSKEFFEIVKNYQSRFSLINDYGSGTVEVCYLLNDKLIWN